METPKDKDIPPATHDDMQKIYERFLQRKAARVEGEWFLFERDDDELGKKIRVHWLNSEGYLDGCGPFATLATMRQWGWTVTPLIIFRNTEIANDQAT